MNSSNSRNQKNSILFCNADDYKEDDQVVSSLKKHFVPLYHSSTDQGGFDVQGQIWCKL